MSVTMCPKKHYQEDEAHFILKFDGDDEIDGETLSIVITNILDMLKAIVVDIEPNAFAKLSVRDTKKGSFILDLVTIVNYLPDLFSNCQQLVSIAQMGVNTFRDMLAIKKHLKGELGKVSKKGEEIIIQNNKGENLSIDVKSSRGDEYFRDCKFDNCIINVATVLNSDEGRSDLRLIQNNEEKLVLKKEDYPRMTVPIIKNDEEHVRIVTEYIEANVFIKKPDFRGNSKWELIFSGRVIKADIEDQEWLNKVHSGEIGGFGAKTIIPVKIRIQYEVDGKNNPIPHTHQYTIISVTGSPRPTPENADLPLI